MPLPGIPALHDGQTRVLSEARRFNVVACGRRWGKTTMGLERIAGPAMQGMPVAWFAPTYKLLLEPWREAVRMFAPMTARKNTTERRIELTTGGVVEFWSVDTEDVARGRKYARVVVDEAAMIAHLSAAWTQALRPTLADYRGDAWFLSTPKGQNFFWRAFTRGIDGEDDEWASWQMPTSANPYIDALEVEAMRRTMPERIYAQEVEAAFLEDAGGVFRRVAECATAVEQTAAKEGHAYAMGVDWGRTNDFTVLTVLDLTTSSVAAVDRFNQIDYSVQTERLRALASRFKVQTIVAETNAMGDPLVEALRRSGLPVVPFHTSGESKGQIIDALALAFETGALAILPDPVAVAELQAYEAVRLPSGRYRYSAPEGLHDDTVMSLALAWSAATTPKRSFTFF